jgi:membrane-bound metal-dependent hydrolase YbcI (DUF457 family)
MWPVGHGSVAYVLYALSTRWRSDAELSHGASILVVFGGLLPDLVDKPFSWYLGVLPAGRSLSHSLLFLVPLVTILYLLSRARGRGELGFAFGLGVLSHPLADALPVLWGRGTATYLLWPLLSIEEPESYPTVSELLRHSLTDPYFLVEFMLLGVALALWRADGYPGLELVPVLRRLRSL